MELFDEFFRIIKAFNSRRIKYAIVGGIAMSFYDYPRFTKDIDILTVTSEVPKIIPVLSKLGYEKSAQPWKFTKTKITLHRFAKIEKDHVLPLDMLVGEENIHRNIVQHAVRLKSKHGIIKMASKEDLIKLKSIRNSAQDKIDIKKLTAYDKNRENNKRN